LTQPFAPLEKRATWLPDSVRSEPRTTCTVPGFRAKLLVQGIMAINAAECTIPCLDYLQLSWLLINSRRGSLYLGMLYPASPFSALAGVQRPDRYLQLGYSIFTISGHETLDIQYVATWGCIQHGSFLDTHESWQLSCTRCSSSADLRLPSLISSRKFSVKLFQFPAISIPSRLPFRIADVSKWRTSCGCSERQLNTQDPRREVAAQTSFGCW
jgi:hypothetical protein